MSARRVLIDDPRGHRHSAIVEVSDSDTVDDLAAALTGAGFGARPISIDGTVSAIEATDPDGVLDELQWGTPLQHTG